MKRLLLILLMAMLANTAYGTVAISENGDIIGWTNKALELVQKKKFWSNQITEIENEIESIKDTIRVVIKTSQDVKRIVNKVKPEFSSPAEAQAWALRNRADDIEEDQVNREIIIELQKRIETLDKIRVIAKKHISDYEISENKSIHQTESLPHEQITYPSLTLQKLPALPPTGAITSANIGVAPLSISVDSNTHYLIKIIDTRTNWDIGQWFIRAGESIDIKVPLGSYKIKYAAGKMWYGLNDLFGNDTIYSKADSTFDFTAHNIEYATQYSGHTIQLIAQPSGNLHTSRMNAADW